MNGPDHAKKIAGKMNRVSRTYAISYELPDFEWRKLRDVYARLPGYCGFDDSGCPIWYSHEEGKGPYLWASVEPSGLLVAGVLDSETWRQWDAAFRNESSRVLGFEVKDADE